MTTYDIWLKYDDGAGRTTTLGGAVESGLGAIGICPGCLVITADKNMVEGHEREFAEPIVYEIPLHRIIGISHQAGPDDVFEKMRSFPDGPDVAAAYIDPDVFWFDEGSLEPASVEHVYDKLGMLWSRTAPDEWVRSDAAYRETWKQLLTWGPVTSRRVRR